MMKDESVTEKKERENAVKSKGSVKSPRGVNVNRTSNPGRKTIKSPGIKVAVTNSRNSD
jgi:hypothetical protein